MNFRQGYHSVWHDERKHMLATRRAGGNERYSQVGKADRLIKHMSDREIDDAARLTAERAANRAIRQHNQGLS